MEPEPEPESRELGVERFEPELGLELGRPPSRDDLSAQILAAAGELGFARAGITSAAPMEQARRRLQVFRERGFAGSMHYLAEGDRHDPAALLPEVRSVIVVAFAHGDPSRLPLERHGLSGEIARYAQGDDYHMKLKTRLLALGRKVATLCGRPVSGRVCVDTAPLLERELATRAGLGFQGKSTLLLTPGVGSYVLLAELLVDVALTPSTPSSGSCGSCRACLDACPTQAFPEANVLDARRCLSYLTIEYEGIFPRELRPALGKRVFGCDVCQEVCPYNASPSRPVRSELGLRPGLRAPDLVELLNLGSAAYRRLVRRTALRRVSRTTLQRNAAIALGNSNDARAVSPLTEALLHHGRELVRAHAAWSLGELGPHLDDAARAALARAANADSDPATQQEAELALARLEPNQGP